MNTKISYMYRDFNNYKQHEDVVLRGELAENQVRLLNESATRSPGFDPHSVGLEALQDRFCDGYQEDQDNEFHEFVSAELTHEAVTLELDAQVFYRDYTQHKL